MAEEKIGEPILTVIDQLRQRKARPDQERICHMTFRKHGLTFDQTRDQLARLVEAGSVIKVDYKGSTSYRNAAKWKRGNSSHPPSPGRVVRDALRALTNAADKISAMTSASARSLDGKSENDKGAPVGQVESMETSNSESEKNGPDSKEVKENNSTLAPVILDGDTSIQAAEAEKSESATKAAASDIIPSRGISLGDLESWILQHNPDSKVREKTLLDTLEKEKQAGRVQENETGDLILVVRRKTNSNKIKKDTPKKESGIGKKHRPSMDSEGEGAAPGPKRKRVKKTLGPDFQSYDPTNKREGAKEEKEVKEVTPAAIRTKRMSRKSLDKDNNNLITSNQDSTSDADMNAKDPLSLSPRCDFCLQGSDCNRRGVPEDLLMCKDCQAKAHPSCMEYNETLAKRARMSPWQCNDCKTCYICEDSADPDAMLFCDACDKGYHMSCHNPPVHDKPTGNWVCSKCVQETSSRVDAASDYSELYDAGSKTSSDAGGASCLLTPNASPPHLNGASASSEKPKIAASLVNGGTFCLPRLADSLPAVTPDASEWTVDDVVQYFREVGFIDQADVFREQEIDGKSLLLLRRNDVLTGLSLKLGPALKIYIHVQKLQTRGQAVG